jgi:hypothetical protein
MMNHVEASLVIRARTISHRSKPRSGPFQSDWNLFWLQAHATQKEEQG